MNSFAYPTPEGGREVAASLGVSAEVMMTCQDWEYTFPTLSDLPRYEQIYRARETSDLAKRVLGCFIFQCLEDHLGGGGAESTVRAGLAHLAQDYVIHRKEFHYWSQIEDAYYDTHPEDGWHIMGIAREYVLEAEPYLARKS